VNAPAHCSHRPPCPGCPRFGEPGIAPEAQALLDDLARRHELPPVPVVDGAHGGFRIRSRLAIRGRSASPKLGMFELDSHRIVHIPHCQVHHPLINEVAECVRRCLIEARVTTYSEAAHAGLARYLQVVIERSSSTAQVVMVGNCPTAAPLAPLLDLIRERLGARLHSLWFNANTAPHNTILGPRFERWCGPASVVERFGGTAIHYPPGAFGQSNLEIASCIIEHISLQLPSDAEVLELYAGVGAIGLSLLPTLRQLVLNEINADSLLGIQLGLAGLDPADAVRVRVLEGAAAAQELPPAQIVIADPPRRGLDRQIIDYLGSKTPERFIYVSCGVDSLRRDIDLLSATGRLRLTGLTAFNLLPFTLHVETVACFERC
jgi:tRNA/tmRNA/rRNA uracil-C5-methylase (TrmA/RlmC/RlmD family)